MMGTFKTGYGQFTIDGIPGYAHRWCLTASGIVIPAGHYACHECDNPACCNPHPKHVRVGTPTDNIVHMYAAGRQGERNYATGDRHGMRKKKLARIAAAAGGSHGCL
jgi:hypothetical protein